MNQRRTFDPGLYLVVGPEHCAAEHIEPVVAQAVRGGVSMVQLRAKSAPTRRFIDIAARVKNVLGEATPLLINDRIDVALAVGAHGVHVGQSDMPPATARRLLGREAIIGLTVRSLDEAKAAPLEVLDYVSIGGVFATQSKSDASAPIGIEGLRAICAHLRARTQRPITAISGITEQNAAQVLAAGVAGIAVVSAICSAGDPQRAAARLRRIVATEASLPNR